MTADSGDLARDVLVHWALPLLSRARRIADALPDSPRFRGTIHDGAVLVDPETLASAELLADDIAALIGHGVTDQPPAPELAEVLAGADLPPVMSDLPGRRGTGDHYRARVARSAAPKKEQGPAAPRIAGALVGPGVDPAEARALMDRVNATRGHAPDAQAMHAPTTPERKSGESAARTPPREAFGPRADRCPTCGTRP